MSVINENIPKLSEAIHCFMEPSHCGQLRFLRSPNKRERRDIKEEAQIEDPVNFDILHEKLVRLEALAKKIDAAEKGTISLIL